MIDNYLLFIVRIIKQRNSELSAQIERKRKTINAWVKELYM